MLVKRFSTCFLVLLVGIFFVACSDAEDEQPTVTPTEVTYSWEANPILISLQTASDYLADYDLAWSLTPEIVVYANGLVVGTTVKYTNSGRLNTYWTGQATQDEMCYLLSQFDELGFFDFQESEYLEPGINHLNITQIVVQGWKSRTITIDGLEMVGPNEGYSPPALAETYQLLSSIQPSNAVPYQPERIALLISRVGDEIPAELWPLAGPDLSELVQGLEQREGREFIFEDEEADYLYNLFEGKWFKLFKSQGEIYKVVLRPLFPLEIWEESDGYGRLINFKGSPKIDLVCSNQAPAPLWITSAAPTPKPIDNVPLGESAPLEHVDSIGAWDEPGQLDIIGSFVSIPEGGLSVADISHHKLIEFALDGTPASEIFPMSIFAIDMAYLPDGRLVMLDYSSNAIQIYSPQGELLQTIENWPPQDGTENDYATENLDSIGVGPDGKIYASERWGNRVIVFNIDGSVHEIWKGPEGDPFESVSDIALDSTGNLFIVDSERGRVIKRSPSGGNQAFLIEKGGQISLRSDGAFYINEGLTVSLYSSSAQQKEKFELDGSISDMTVAPNGLGVIVEADLAIIPGKVFHYFDEEGNLLRSFGTSIPLQGQFYSHNAFSVSAVGDVWVIANTTDEFGYGHEPNELLLLNSNFSLVSNFDSVDGKKFSCLEYSLAAVSDHSVFIADPCMGTIARINSAGDILSQWGRDGVESGQINLISDIALAPDELSLYVVDAGNRRVIQFGLDGQVLSEWEGEHLDVQFPTAIDISSDGMYFLIDGASHEVVIWSPEGLPVRWMLPTSNEGPFDIAIDEGRQRIYVGGTDVNLYVYDWFGNYLGVLGHWDASGVMVNVGSEGNLYRSAGYREIQVYFPVD